MSNPLDLIAKEYQKKQKRNLINDPSFLTNNNNSNSLIPDVEVYSDYAYEKNPNVLNYNRWSRQSAWDQTGNFLMQAAGKEIIGGTIHGVGAVLDIPDMISSLTNGEPIDFNNAITEFADSIMESTEENFPIYRRDPNATWDVGDWGWWMQNSVSVASSIGLMLPALGATKAVSSFSKLAKLLTSAGKTSKLSSNAQTLINMTTMPIVMRHGENFRESAETSKRIYEEAYNKFSSMPQEEILDWINSEEGKNFKVDVLGLDVNDDKLEQYLQGKAGIYDTPNANKELNKKAQNIFNDFTPENIAKYIASTSAWKTYKLDAANVVFDAVQFLPIVGLMKGGSTGFLKNFTYRPSSVLKAEFKEVGKLGTKAASKAIRNNRLRNIGVYVGSASTEGPEEIINFVAQEEGMLYGRHLLGQKNKYAYTEFGDRVDEYLSDPLAWEQGFWGFMGGLVFSGGMHAANKIQSARGKNRTESSQLTEINSRKVKLLDAINKSKLVDDGFDPFNPNATSEDAEQRANSKFEVNYNTPAEREQAIQNARDRIADDLTNDLYIQAERNDATDRLNKYLEDEQTKEFLVSNKIATTENVNEIVKDIVSRGKEVAKEYNKHYTKLGGYGVNPGIAAILASQAIHSESTIKAISKRSKELEDAINNIITSESYETAIAKTIKNPITGEESSLGAFVNTYLEALVYEQMEKELSKIENQDGQSRLFGKTIDYYRDKIEEYKQRSGIPKDFKSNLSHKVFYDLNLIPKIGEANSDALFNDTQEKIYNDLQIGKLKIKKNHLLTVETAEEKEKEFKKAQSDLKKEIIDGWKETAVNKLKEIESKFGELENVDAAVDEVKSILNETIEKNKIEDTNFKNEIKKEVESTIESKRKETKQKYAEFKKIESQLKARNEILIKENINKLVEDIKATKDIQHKINRLLYLRKLINKYKEQIPVDQRKEYTSRSKKNDFDKTHSEFLNDIKNIETIEGKLEHLNVKHGHLLTTYNNKQLEQLIKFVDTLKGKINKTEKAELNEELRDLFYDILGKNTPTEVKSTEENTKKDNTREVKVTDTTEYTPAQYAEAALKQIEKYAKANNITENDTLSLVDFIEYAYLNLVQNGQLTREEFESPIINETFRYVFKILKEQGKYSKVLLGTSKVSTIVSKIENRLSQEQPVQQDFSNSEQTKSEDNLPSSGLSINTQVLNFPNEQYEGDLDYETDANGQWTGNIIIKNQRSVNQYEAILNLQSGDDLVFKIDTAFKGINKFIEDKDINNIPIGIYNKDGVFIGHLQHMDTINNQIDFLRSLYKDDNLQIIQLLYDNFKADKIKAYKNKKQYDKIIESIAHQESVLYDSIRQLLGLKNPNNALEEQINSENPEEAKKKYLKEVDNKYKTFLNITVRQKDNYDYYNTKDDLITIPQIKEIYEDWYGQLRSDKNIGLFIRNKIGFDKNAKHTQPITYLSTGDIVNNYNNPNSLEAFDTAENIQLLKIADNSNGMRLEDMEGNKLPDSYIKAEGFKQTTPGYFLVEVVGKRNGNRRKIPGFIQTTTYDLSEDAKYLNEDQKEYNEMFFDWFVDTLNTYNNEYYKKTKNNPSNTTELHNKIKEYIYLLEKGNTTSSVSFKFISDGVKKTVSIMPTKLWDDKRNSPSYIRIVVFDQNGKEEFKTTSYKDNYKPTLKKILSGTKKNLVHSKIKNNKARSNFRYIDEITRKTSKSYSSYKEFAIKTGLIVTPTGYVVGPNGRKLGNVTPKNSGTHHKLGRPLKIKINPNLQEKNLEQIKLELLNNNTNYTSVEELFTLAENAGVQIKYSKDKRSRVNKDGSYIYDEKGNIVGGILTFNNNTITIYTDYFQEDKSIRDLLILHELIHNAIDVKSSKLTPEELKTFTDSIVDFNIELLNTYKDNKETIRAKFSQKELEYIDQILNIIDEVSKDKNEYDNKNEEIITYALANKTFARFLNSIEGKETKEGAQTKTLWSKLVDLISDLINKIAGNTKLDELKAILNNHLEINTPISQLLDATAEARKENLAEDSDIDKDTNFFNALDKHDTDITSPREANVSDVNIQLDELHGKLNELYNYDVHKEFPKFLRDRQKSIVPRNEIAKYNTLKAEFDSITKNKLFDTKQEAFDQYVYYRIKFGSRPFRDNPVYTYENKNKVVKYRINFKTTEELKDRPAIILDVLDSHQQNILVKLDFIRAYQKEIVSTKRKITEVLERDYWDSLSTDQRNSDRALAEQDERNASVVDIKEGVTELFESNSELANIGTQQLYSKYLDTIFPDSKVKDIVYHGGQLTKNNIYFTKSKSYAKKYNESIVTGILNIANPEYTSNILKSGAIQRGEKQTNIPEFLRPTTKEFIPLDKDSVINNTYDEIVVFKSEQIHILGSKQDIQGFKEFVNNERNVSVTEPYNHPEFGSVDTLSIVEGLAPHEVSHAINLLSGIIMTYDFKDLATLDIENGQNTRLYKKVLQQLIKDFKRYNPTLYAKRKTDPQISRFFGYVVRDLESIDENKSSYIWDRVRARLKAQGVFVKHYDVDVNETSKTWEEEDYKTKGVLRISGLVKKDIFSTPKANEGTITFNSNDELTLEDNDLVLSPISGMPERLSNIEANDIINKLIPSISIEDMMKRLKDAAYTTDKSYLRLYDLLSKSEDKRKQWFHSMNMEKQIRYGHRINNTPEQLEIQSVLTTRNTNPAYNLSSDWRNNITITARKLIENKNIDSFNSDIKAIVKQIRLAYAKNDLIAMTNALSFAYSKIGISIEPSLITKLANNDELLKDIDVENKQVELLNRYLLTPLVGDSRTDINGVIGFVNDYYKNIFTEFDEKGAILKLAALIKNYKKIGENSYQTIDNQNAYSITNSSFLTFFFKTINSNSKIGQDAALEWLKDIATSPAMQHENILWHENDDNPGLLYYEGDDINKIPTSLNKEFAAKFTHHPYEGASLIGSNIVNKYEQLSPEDFNIIALTDYLQIANKKLTSFVATKNEKNYGLFTTLIPSDKTTYYKIASKKYKLDGIELNLDNKTNNAQIVDWESDIAKAFLNVYYQQYERIRQAADLIFEKNEKGSYIRVKPEAYTGRITIDDITVDLQENKHFKYDSQNNIYFLSKPQGSNSIQTVDNINDATDFAGNVFSFHQFDNFNIDIFDILRGDKNTYLEQVKDIINNQIQLEYSKTAELYNLAELNKRIPLENQYKSILDFALNTYLFNITQQNLLFGNTFEFKNTTDQFKRTFQAISPVKYAAANNNEVYLASTVNDIVVTSTLLPELIQSVSKIYSQRTGTKLLSLDAQEAIRQEIIKGKPSESTTNNSVRNLIYTTLKNYGKIKSTDGQSYITLKEFKNRLRKFGIYENYQDVFNKLDNNEELNAEEIKYLLQPQKNFYYERKLDVVGKDSSGNNIYDLRSLQIKNSEFILVPQLLPDDRRLKKLHQVMTDNHIAQVNFKTAEKVGSGYVSTIHNEDKTFVDDLETQLLASTKEFKYKYLGLQQELPSHVVDHKNKLGIQIARLILNNINRDKAIYKLGNETQIGNELIEKYFDSYTSNIKQGAFNILTKLGVDFETAKFLSDPNYITNENFRPNIHNAIKILKEYAETKGLTPNDLDGLSIPEGENNPNLPIFYSGVAYKWQEILTNIFTREVIVQKIPGPHAIQASQALVDLDALTSNNLVLRKQSAEENVTQELKGAYWDANGVFHPDEILLPAWTKPIIAKKNNIPIEKLDQLDLNIMVGYRIPTEDKHSMSVMKVVGFLDNYYGSTIIVPDESIPRNGSDFDIDTLYMMSYSLEYNNNRELQKVQFLDNDNSTVEERYNKKHRPIYSKYGNKVEDKLSNISKEIDIINNIDEIDNDTKAEWITYIKEGKDAQYIKEKYAKIKEENDNIPIGLEEFKELSLSDQNTTKANANRIVDIYISILSNETHAIENIIPNGFEDIAEAKRKLELVSDNQLNPLSYATQSKFRERAIAAVALKGISVNILNFVGFAQYLNAQFNPALHIKIGRGLGIESARRSASKINTYSDANSDNILTLSHLGRNNKTNDYFNDQHHSITTYSSQAVANILDAINDPLPENVNSETVVPWMVIPSMGGTWAFSTYLINTRLFKEYAKLKKGTILQDSNQSERSSRLEAITKSSGYYDVLRESGYEALGLTNQERFDIENSVDKYEYHASENDLLFLERPTFNSKEDILQHILIEKSLNQTFNKVLDISKIINDGVFAFSVDRESIGPNLFKYDLLKEKIATFDRHTYDNDPNPMALYENKKPALFTLDEQGNHITLTDAVYNPNRNSHYSPMAFYYKYGFELGNKVLSPLFINSISNYNEYHKQLTKYTSNENIHRRFDFYIIKHLMENNEFLSDVVGVGSERSNRQRILGIESNTNKLPIRDSFDFSDKSIENYERFAKLSLSNKIDLIKVSDHYTEWRNQLGEADLFNYLETLTTNPNASRYNHKRIFFRNSDSETLQETFRLLFTNKDIYLRDIAHDLIRYNYITNGLSFGANLSKIIPSAILYRKYDSNAEIPLGIGLAETLYDAISTFEITDDIMANFLKSEISIIPIFKGVLTSLGNNIFIIPNNARLISEKRSISLDSSDGIFKIMHKRGYVHKLPTPGLFEDYLNGERNLLLLSKEDLGNGINVSLGTKIQNRDNFIEGKLVNSREIDYQQYLAFKNRGVYSINEEKYYKIADIKSKLKTSELELLEADKLEGYVNYGNSSYSTKWNNTFSNSTNKGKGNLYASESMLDRAFGKDRNKKAILGLVHIYDSSVYNTPQSINVNYSLYQYYKKDKNEHNPNTKSEIITLAYNIDPLNTMETNEKSDLPSNNRAIPIRDARFKINEIVKNLDNKDRMASVTEPGADKSITNYERYKKQVEFMNETRAKIYNQSKFIKLATQPHLQLEALYDNIKEIRLLDLKIAFTTANHYYESELEEVQDILNQYKDVDIAKLIEDRELLTKLNDNLLFADRFIKSLDYIKELTIEDSDKLSKTEEEVNDLIKELKAIKVKAEESKARLLEIRIAALRHSLMKYTTNPEILEGFKDLLGSISDESYFQLWLDPLFDTHNPLVASMIKKYRISIIEAKFEYTKKQREWKKVLRDNNITSKEDFEKYLESDVSGKLPIVIQKYKEEYRNILYDFIGELDEIKKRTGSTSSPEYVKVKMEFDNWKLNHLSNKYNDDYVKDQIELNNILKESEEAAQFVYYFREEKNKILAKVNNEASKLNEEDHIRLDELNSERLSERAEFEIIEDRRVKKEGKSLIKAKVLNKYYEKYRLILSKYYDDIVNEKDFNKAKEKAKNRSKSEFNKWLVNNTKVIIDNKFFDLFKEKAAILRKNKNDEFDYLIDLVSDIQKRYKDTNGIIDGTLVEHVEDLKGIKEKEQSTRAEKSYIPKTFTKTTGVIYTDKYYTIKHKGQTSKTPSIVADLRQEAVNDIHELLKSRNMINRDGSLKLESINSNTMADLNNIIRKFELANNMYNHNGEYRGDDFVSNEILNKNRSSYTDWFLMNHKNEPVEGAFETAKQLMENRLEELFDSQKVAFVEQWNELFTTVKIDEATLKEFYNRLSLLASGNPKTLNNISTFLKLDHLLKPYRNYNNEIDNTKLTADLFNEVNDILIEAERRFQEDQANSKYKLTRKVYTIDKLSKDDFVKEADLIKAGYDEFVSRSKNPYDLMEYVPTNEYFIQFRSNIKNIKAETLEIINTYLNPTKDSKVSVEQLNKHILDNYFDDIWYKDHHYATGQGVMPKPYYVKLETRDKSKITYNAPKDIFFSDLKVTNDDYIDKDKTEAAKWIKENVSFKETEYYNKIRKALENGQKVSLIFINEKTSKPYVKDVDYSEWYNLNHYYDVYEGRDVPLSIWKQIIPINREEYVKSLEPSDNWRKLSVKDGTGKDGISFLNENYEEDNFGNPLPRETKLDGTKSELLNSKYDKVKKDPVYKLLTEILKEGAFNYGRGSILDAGYLPSESTNSDNNVGQKLLRKIGWYKKGSKFKVESDDETIRFLDFPFIKMIVKERPIKYDKRKLNETNEEYEKRIIADLEEAKVTKPDGSSITSLKELKEENKRRYKENKEYHKEQTSYDVDDLITKFIKFSTIHKYKKNIESELLNTIRQVNESKFKRKSGKLEASTDKVTQVLSGKQSAEDKNETSNLSKHFNEWMTMIFYDDFEVDQGDWTKLARVLQNYTSAKGMWFNLTGAFNNVAYGNTQMAMESAGSEFWQYKHSLQAEKDYWKNIFQMLNKPENGRYTSKLAAIVNFADVLMLQDERDYGVTQRAKNKLFKNLMSTNNLFALHHIGEHYMQNKALVSMLYSHKVIGGKAQSFKDYLGHLSYNTALEILGETSLNSNEGLKGFVVQQQKKYDKSEKYTINDYVTWYIQTRRKDKLKEYNTKLKEINKKAKDEFNKYNDLTDAFELDEHGELILLEDKLSEKEWGSFTERVIGVNHKIHGVYNKADANAIQKGALGRLSAQFRKFARPGFNKRWGARIGKPSWNERRQSWDRPAYIDAYRFITRPIMYSKLQREQDGENTSAAQFAGNLLKSYAYYISNIKLMYDTLSESEKASIKRTTMEMMIFTAFITIIPLLLQSIKGDDDPEDMGLASAFLNPAARAQWMLYQQDRVWTELAFYTPFGAFNEGRKILKTPFAGMTSIEQMLAILSNSLYYPFRDEEERTYRGGLYHGDDKLLTQVKKSIPIYNQLDFKFKHLGKYYKLYSLK